MTAWEKQNESPSGSSLDPQDAQSQAGEFSYVARRDYGKFTNATPASRVVLAFLSMWGLRVALRLQRAASRPAACGRRVAGSSTRD